MNKRINNLLKFGSCLLIFILPLIYFGSKIFIYSYITSKIFLFYGLVEILFALWIYAVITDRSYRLSRKTWFYFVPLGAYLVWMTIAGILGTNPALSFWASLGRGTGLLTLYHSLAFALVIASLVKKNGDIYMHKFMQWFLNGSFILAISVWCGNEGFNLFSFLKDSGGGGLMGNSSFTAAYLLFALAFGFLLLFSKSISKNKKWWTIIKMITILFSPLFFNIYGLFIGHGLLGSARGATLGIIVMGIVTLLVYLFFSEKKIIKIIGITGIVLGIVIFSFGWAQLINPNTKLHQKFVESASGTRFIFWNSAQEAMNEHPYIGYGPENYAIAFQQNFNPEIIITGNTKDNHADETWTDHAHNIYYETGVAGGYPAIILYILFILSIPYALYKLEQTKKFNRIQVAVLVGLIVGYIFQDLFVFDSLHSLVALFTLAGIIFAYQDFSSIKEKYLPVHINSFARNTLVWLLVAACLLSTIFFVYRPLQKDIAYSKVINMWIDQRPSQYMGLLQGSSVGEQLDVGMIAGTIVAHYAGNLVEIKNDKELAPYALNDLKALSQYLEVVIKTNKTDARLYLTLVDSYIVENSLTDKPYDEALAKHLFDLLDYAEKLSPANPVIYWDRAQVYIWSLDIKNTEQEYQKAIDVGPMVPQSHQFLISFAKWVNDQKLYSSSLLEAEKDIPGFKMP